MPRLNAVRPVMSTEFEERFRKILKRVYRSLQQFEIRDEVFFLFFFGRDRGFFLTGPFLFSFILR